MPDSSGAAIRDAEQKMLRTVEFFQRELQGMRAGRAHPALLDKVVVDYYGALTPLPHLGQVAVPEPRTLVVQPYDKSAVGAVEKAIQKADLGLGIQVDGSVLRLTVPPLTEDRRRDLVKQLRRRLEDERVSLRNSRREAQDAIKADRTLPEDDARRLLDQLQKITDRYVKQLEDLASDKEHDLLTP
jgi:ribosome recycling factor